MYTICYKYASHSSESILRNNTGVQNGYRIRSNFSVTVMAEVVYSQEPRNWHSFARSANSLMPGWVSIF